MAYDLQEQESIDEFKAFWNKWGNAILTAITLICLAFASYNGYQWYKRYKAQNAAVAYGSLQTAIAHNQAVESVEKIVTSLLDDGAGTAYAPMGALNAAKYFAIKGSDAACERMLNWVIADGDHPEYQTVARVRLAGMQMDAKNFDAAVTTLSAATATDEQKALVNDRLGDAYFAKGELEKARAAWQEAQKHPIDQALASVIELKLQTLPRAK